MRMNAKSFRMDNLDSVNVVVVGDAGVGKTSLITSLVSESYAERVTTQHAVLSRSRIVIACDA